MIPIVSAVGHETDWTLIDLAADVRAPTPTGAAEMVVPVKAEIEVKLATLAARLSSGIGRNLETARTGLRAAARGLPTPDSLFAIHSQRFDTAAASLGKGLVSVIQKKGLQFEKTNGKLGFSLLSSPVERKKQHLLHQSSRLEFAARARIEHHANRVARARLSPGMLLPVIASARQRTGFAGRSMDRLRIDQFERLHNRLDQATRLLGSYSHAKTLARGFALVRNSEGRVMTRSAQMSPGSAFELEFADGKANVLAQSGDTISPPQAVRKKPDSGPAGSGNQGSLF